MNSVIVKDLPDALNGRHVFRSRLDKNVYRSDDLGLGKLPAVKLFEGGDERRGLDQLKMIVERRRAGWKTNLVNGEDSRNILDGLSKVVERDGAGDGLKEDERGGFD